MAVYARQVMSSTCDKYQVLANGANQSTNTSTDLMPKSCIVSSQERLQAASCSCLANAHQRCKLKELTGQQLSDSQVQR